MIKLFKVSLVFNRTFKNRGGRFITVYDNNRKAFNGKVLTSNVFFARIQLARDPKTVIRVKNWSVKFVCADHFIWTTNGKV
jgi:hypothetical protein